MHRTFCDRVAQINPSIIERVLTELAVCGRSRLRYDKRPRAVHFDSIHVALCDSKRRMPWTFFFFFFLTHIYFPASGQAVVTGVVPSLPPGFCLHFLSRIGFSNPIARRFFIECC